MGTFRELSESDVRGILASFGIDGYRGHSPIAAGTINTNLRVDTAAGLRFLRVNEGKTEGDVERESAIVAHVAARGVITPVPARTTAGRACLAWSGSFVSLFPWVPGRTLVRAEVTPAHAGQVGRALGGLHAAGVDFADHRPGRYEPDEIQRRFVQISQVAGDDTGLQQAVGILGSELAQLAADRRPDVPLGLIHGDLFIDNVLFDEVGGLTALLDFEQASWGRLVYDIAVCVLAFGFGRDDFRADVTRAFLDGYKGVRPATAAERDAFSAELRFAACRFAVTRITDVYLRRAPGAPAGKDYGRYLQRLDCVRKHVGSGDGLLLLT